MIFGANMDSSYTLPMLKHVAEIILHRKQVIYNNLCNKSADAIKSELVSKGLAQGTPTRQIQEYVKLLAPGQHDLHKWFSDQLTVFLMRFNTLTLLVDYAETDYAQKQLKNHLLRSLRKHYRMDSVDIPDADWSDIFRDFSETMLHSRRTNEVYDPGTNNIVGYLVNTFKFYLSGNWNYVTNTINSRGINATIGDSDYTTGDLMSVDVDYQDDLPNFPKIVAAILEMNFLFKHNNREYYDAFSRYKFKLASSKFEGVEALVSKHFRNNIPYSKPRLNDRNFRVVGGKSEKSADYAESKLIVRNNMLKFVDPIMEDKLGMDDLAQVIKDMESYNRDLIIAGGVNNDKLPVFGDTVNGYTYSPKGDPARPEALRIIINGMTALRDFVNYLNRIGENILKVPSDVFQNPQLIRRYRSYLEYKQLHSVVQDLMQNAPPASTSLYTNDQAYEDLTRGLDTVRNLPLTDIKKAFEQFVPGPTKKKVSTLREPFVSKTLVDNARVLLTPFINTNSQVKQGTIAYSFRLMGTTNLDDLKKWVSNPPKFYKPAIYSEGEQYQYAPYYVSGNLEGHTFREVYKSVGNGEPDKFFGPLLGDFSDDLAYGLSLWRGRLFTEKFIRCLNDTLNKLQAMPTVWELDMALFIHNNKERFQFPRNPVRYTEFDWFLGTYNVDLFLTAEQTPQDINAHLLKLYNQLYEHFRPIFRWFEQLYTNYYDSFASSLRLVEQATGHVTEAKLKQASVQIYSNGVNTELNSELRKFTEFRNNPLVTPNRYGFLTLRGKLYQQEYMGIPALLHERGYWVWFNGDNVQRIKVSADDVFKG